MLEFVREIQTRGIHSNSILLLVPQSWRVWTSIITLCSSSRCLCIYICFFKQLPVESLARFRVSTTWFEGWSGEGRGERRKTRKTSGTDLGEGRCHFFPFVLQRCTKFRHYFVYSFLEAEKEPMKKRCMRMPERQFLLTDHVMGIRQRDSSKGEWQQLVG